jgi:two-component system sensor histidine kinase/response regulator
MPKGPSNRATWDPAKALERVDGDEALLREIIKIFLDETPRLLTALRQGVSEGNAATVERAAHSLKGELSYFGLEELRQKAWALEQMGRDRDLNRAAEVFDSLQEELSVLATEMRLNHAPARPKE